MGLVHDDRVVAVQQTVPLDLGEQDAVRHHLDERVRANPVGKADRVAHGGAEGGAEFVGDALGDGACGNPSWLGMADDPGLTAPGFEAQLGQLRALARSGLSCHDDHLVVGDGGEQLLPASCNGELRRV